MHFPGSFLETKLSGSTSANRDLKKTNSTVVKPDNAAIRGMIFKVKHLVKVEEV